VPDLWRRRLGGSAGTPDPALIVHRMCRGTKRIIRDRCAFFVGISHG
jgi:hypothetical protein